MGTGWIHAGVACACSADGSGDRKMNRDQRWMGQCNTAHWNRTSDRNQREKRWKGVAMENAATEQSSYECVRCWPLPCSCKGCHCYARAHQSQPLLVNRKAMVTNNSIHGRIGINNRYRFTYYWRNHHRVFQLWRRIVIKSRRTPSHLAFIRSHIYETVASPLSAVGLLYYRH